MHAAAGAGEARTGRGGFVVRGTQGVGVLEFKGFGFWVRGEGN